MSADAIPPIRIQICRPRLPAADSYRARLEGMDESGWFSNFGPLNAELESRLEAYFGLGPGTVLMTSSGTAALSAALRAVALPDRPLCLMPSWTFVATPSSALAVGLTPHFVDIDPVTWMPDPTQMEARADLDQVAAVIVVAPFGAAVDIAGWMDFRARTGIPVVIDAAAAFDTLPPEGPMTVGPIPVAVSMHATKTFAVGEAGAVLTTDRSVADGCRSATNFGFLGSREARVIGFNGKLCEPVAAIGLAALDAWPETREGWLDALRTYLDVIPDNLRSRFWIPGDGSTIVSTLNCHLPSATAARAAETRLAGLGIETRRWWSAGCHRQPAFLDLPADPLPETDRLAAEVLGLPIWPGIPKQAVEEIVSVVAGLNDGG